MPRKGMRSIFSIKSSPSSSPKTSKYNASPSQQSNPPSSSHSSSYSESLLIQDAIRNAEFVFSKWEISSGLSSSKNNKAASLFSQNEQDARDYFSSIRDLHKILHSLFAQDSKSEIIIRAQKLMQMAMRRLEDEFRRILLSINRDIYPAMESVTPTVYSPSNGWSVARSSTATGSDTEDESSEAADLDEFNKFLSETLNPKLKPVSTLRAIADCMIASGYGKECLRIYISVRKHVIDDTLRKLGVESLSFSKIDKMDWDVLEIKIKSWLNATSVAVSKLFRGESILSPLIFHNSSSVSEACFTNITKEAAETLFGFAEMVARKKKKMQKSSSSHETIFYLLDMYQCIAELWPEIMSTFSYRSTSSVRSYGVKALIKLGESIRKLLVKFESFVKKESSKNLVPGGGVAPLTVYAMDYITRLAEYDVILGDIIGEWPAKAPAPLPNFITSATSATLSRFAWMILVLLCKLDGKADLYAEVPLSYVFLMNNVQYVIVKARESKLVDILDGVWFEKHEENVKQYVASYERIGWSKVLNSLPTTSDLTPNMIPSDDAVEKHFGDFNLMFEQVYNKHREYVILDSELRNEIKVSLAKSLITKYNDFYEKYCGSVDESVVKYAPDDLGHYLSDLFF